MVPAIWSAIAPWIGGPRMHIRPGLTNLISLPIYDFQGAKDQPRLVEVVREVCAELKKRGGDVTYVEDATRGHAVDHTQFPKILTWARARPREPYPRSISFAVMHAAFSEHAWVRIDKTAPIPDLRSTRPSVRVARGATQAQLRAAYVKQARKKLATVEAKWLDGNRIVIKTKRVNRLTIFLSPDMIDPTKPVSIKWNGRNRRVGVVAMNIAFLLEHARSTTDLTRTFGASVTLP